MRALVMTGVAVLAVSVASAATPVPDAFLLAWVRSSAAPTFFPSFRKDFPCSPHAADSERYEFAARAQALEGQVGAEKTHAVAQALLQELEKPKATPLVRAKALFVLPRLQDPTVVPKLIALATSGDARERHLALEGLRFFGARPASDFFLTFGGRPSRVSYAAHPVAEATSALVAIAQGADEALRAAAWRALETHEGPAVDAAVVKTPPDEDADVTVIARVAALPRDLAVPWLLAALEKTHDAKLEAVAEGLVRHGEHGPRAIAALLGALEHGARMEFHVALETLRALHGMAGPSSADSFEERSLLVALWKERLDAAVH